MFCLYICVSVYNFLVHHLLNVVTFGIFIIFTYYIYTNTKQYLKKIIDTYIFGKKQYIFLYVLYLSLNITPVCDKIVERRNVELYYEPPLLCSHEGQDSCKNNLHVYSFDP